MGIVRQSNSEFTSPILLVTNKTDEKHLSMNFPVLISITTKESHTLPLFDDQLDQTDETVSRHWTLLQGTARFCWQKIANQRQHYAIRTLRIRTDGICSGQCPGRFLKKGQCAAVPLSCTTVMAYMDNRLIPNRAIDEGWTALKWSAVWLERRQLNAATKEHFFLRRANCAFGLQDLHFANQPWCS